MLTIAYPDLALHVFVHGRLHVGVHVLVCFHNEDTRPHAGCGPAFWMYVALCVGLVAFSAVMAGLTVALMSLGKDRSMCDTWRDRVQKSKSTPCAVVNDSGEFGGSPSVPAMMLYNTLWNAIFVSLRCCHSLVHDLV